MDHIGIDVHKVESQICILSADGEVIERRIRTERSRFAEVFGDRSRARIVIESSTESEWVARVLEELGHEVVVADPNFAPMYATRSKKVKTDKRDARTLADASRLGAYRPAHRASDAQRHARAHLAVREAIVRTRSRYISLVRALFRREGIRIPDGDAARFAKRVSALALPSHLAIEAAPLMRLMENLNAEIGDLDTVIAAIGAADERVRKLQSIPSVGPVTATAFVATIDDAKRFKNAHQVESYVGLVPSENSSGEKQRKGGITKAGPPRLRYLLVQAAWGILRSRTGNVEELRAWAMRIASTRGKKIAVVALARKLAGVLFALMRDGTEYDPKKTARPRMTSSSNAEVRAA